MHKIIFFILLTCFPVFSLHAETQSSTINRSFIIAQSTPEIELPTLPDTPPITAPTEEENAEGDTITPPLPPLPELPSTTTNQPKPEADKPLMPALPTDIPLTPVTPPSEPIKEAEKKENPAEAPTETPATTAEQPTPSSTEEQAKPSEPVTPPATEEVQPTTTTPTICASLPKSIENCKAYSCEYPDFDKNFPGFVKTWTVVRKDGDNCEYNESMPRNATLQCRLSEKNRKPYADYLNSVVLQQKGVTDKEILDGYNNARQNECQILSEDGEVLDPKLYNTLTGLPENVEDYGASDAPNGDCDTLEEKLKTCEPFYCKGNDPLQEKFFNRKVEIERKIIGWVENTCIYVQKTGGKNLVGCKYSKTDGTTASQCNVATLTEIARIGTLFNKKTLAEKAAEGETTIKKPEKEEETELSLATNKETLMAMSELNYKTQILPYIIHKKQYDKQNKDLPIAYYPEEFKQMAFSALDRNDLVTLKAFIAKVNEIDGQLKKQKKPPLGGMEIKDTNGNTLLIRSIMIGNFKAARMLIGEGADIEAKNNSGVTALQAASYEGREDLVVLLLGMGAKRDTADKYGRTALTHAIEKRYDTITKLLLSRNADPNAVAGINIPPLITAVKLGNSNASSSLLDNKANINIKDDQGRTALMYAAENGDITLVKMLVQRGANVFSQDRYGQTAEVLASKAGHADVARLLATAAINKRLRR